MNPKILQHLALKPKNIVRFVTLFLKQVDAIPSFGQFDSYARLIFEKMSDESLVCKSHLDLFWLSVVTL